jgi:hypothetical protein
VAPPSEASALKGPEIPIVFRPETHPYFGTLFRVLDSHAFWRTAASGCESGSNARKSVTEFELFSGQLEAGATVAIEFFLFRTPPAFLLNDTNKLRSEPESE